MQVVQECPGIYKPQFVNAQHWLRENIKLDMMVLQKVSIDACAVSTNWKLLTSGMSMSLEA